MKAGLKNFSFSHYKVFYWFSPILGFYIAYYLPEVLKWPAIAISIMGFAYAVIAEFVRIQKGDELERKIYLDSLLISFSAFTVLFYGSYLISMYIYGHIPDFLNSVLVVSMFLIQPIASSITKKRYR